MESQTLKIKVDDFVKVADIFITRTRERITKTKQKVLDVFDFVIKEVICAILHIAPPRGPDVKINSKSTKKTTLSV